MGESKETGRRGAPTTIDLFCGAGGITEGFRSAGFRCLYANDRMKEAIATFNANHLGVWTDERDIGDVNPSEVRAKLGLAKGALDVLVGGPPCQGFSINAPERFLSDPRNKLFQHYARFLDEFRPRTFLFENVPGLLSLGDGKVFERIQSEFQRLGYFVTCKILLAAQYGVPQERWRLILLGSRQGQIEPPGPTHFAEARANFRGGSTLVFRTSDIDRRRLSRAVTVGEALRDLPRLAMGQGQEVASYSAAADCPFAKKMRRGSEAVFNHVAAKLSRQNAERITYLRPGGSWRDIPHALLPKGMQRARRSDHTKRYGRLRHDGLSGTVMTKCDPHWGAVILPDQDRSLTVREAARLQSFPDTYRFFGPRVSQYEQVGNAVPVLMARAIALQIKRHLADFRRRGIERE